MSTKFYEIKAVEESVNQRIEEERQKGEESVRLAENLQEEGLTVLRDEMKAKRRRFLEISRKEAEKEACLIEQNSVALISQIQVENALVERLAKELSKTLIL